MWLIRQTLDWYLVGIPNYSLHAPCFPERFSCEDLNTQEHTLRLQGLVLYSGSTMFTTYFGSKREIHHNSLNLELEILCSDSMTELKKL